jgi:hypothetical protein
LFHSFSFISIFSAIIDPATVFFDSPYDPKNSDIAFAISKDKIYLGPTFNPIGNYVVNILGAMLSERWTLLNPIKDIEIEMEEDNSWSLVITRRHSEKTLQMLYEKLKKSGESLPMKVLFLLFLISILNKTFFILFFLFYLLDYPNDIFSTASWNIDFERSQSSS